MDSTKFNKISLTDFKWINKPQKWNISDKVLEVTTDEKTDYCEGTWYNFHHSSGHIYGVEIKDDFTFTVCVEGEFTHLYDQAGLIIYLDNKHWLKAGIEYNYDGQPMIGSVLTNDVSDWASGVRTGNPRKFFLRMTRKGDVACAKYSTDNKIWTLLRLCSMPFSKSAKIIVGPMCCTPLRKGLKVKFSEIFVTVLENDIMH